MSTTISTANTIMSGIIKSSVIPTATSTVTHIASVVSITPSVTSVTTVIAVSTVSMTSIGVSSDEQIIGKNSSSVVAIVIGCVVGIAVCVIIMILIVLLLWYKKKRIDKAVHSQSVGMYSDFIQVM